MAPLVFEREPRVIYAEAMQNGRVEIMHIHRIFTYVVAELIRLAIDRSRLDATARQPQAKTPRMMVAAVVSLGQRSLGVNGSAELSAPDHKRVVEHAALFQILHQRSRRLIRLLALPPNLFWQIAVLVPSAVEQLNKSDAAFRKSSREDTVGGKRARLARVRPVQFERRLGFRRQIRQFGN